MTMNRKQALTTLRLNSDTTSSGDIERAFLKLCTRYPAHGFPDRFREIREAYELLRDPAAEYVQLLRNERVDATFLVPYLTPTISPRNVFFKTDEDFAMGIARKMISEC